MTAELISEEAWMLTQERLVAMHVLETQALSIRAIGRKLGVSRNTVRRYLRDRSLKPLYPRREVSEVALIVTNYLPFSQWSGAFANDMTHVAALLDRSLHHSHIVQISGESYRLKGKNSSGIEPTNLASRAIMKWPRWVRFESALTRA
jgi:hypothetical protein